MRLFLEAQSERGKPITKSGNEYLNIEVCNEKREPIANIMFDYKNLCIFSIRENIELDQRIITAKEKYTDPKMYMEGLM